MRIYIRVYANVNMSEYAGNTHCLFTFFLCIIRARMYGGIEHVDALAPSSAERNV